MDRGAPIERRAVARVSALPLTIAHRELRVMKEELGLQRGELCAEDVKSPRGPGNTASLTWRCEHVTEIFTGFGAKGKSAEEVARDVVTEAKRWESASVPVGGHQADQLVLLLALAGEGAFLTLAPSLHTRTQRELIPRFWPVAIGVSAESADRAVIRVRS